MTPDWFRFIVITILVVSFVMNVATLLIYTEVYRRLPRGIVRLNPAHVTLVASGSLMVKGSLAWALIAGLGDRLDTEGYIRLGLYAGGSALVIASLVVSMRKSYLQIREFRRVRKDQMG